MRIKILQDSYIVVYIIEHGDGNSPECWSPIVKLLLIGAGVCMAILLLNSGHSDPIGRCTRLLLNRGDKCKYSNIYSRVVRKVHLHRKTKLYGD